MIFETNNAPILHDGVPVNLSFGDPSLVRPESGPPLAGLSGIHPSMVNNTKMLWGMPEHIVVSGIAISLLLLLFGFWKFGVDFNVDSHSHLGPRGGGE